MGGGIEGWQDMSEETVDRGHGAWAKVATVGMEKRGWIGKGGGGGDGGGGRSR